MARIQADHGGDPNTAPDQTIEVIRHAAPR
jgi:hypothetical protein